MIKKVVLILLFICLYNCEELIEVEDISNEVVTVLAPVDNAILETNGINFSWQTLEFAETYHLQVAKPSFVAAQEIVLDTIISSINFTKILESSPYQWRIKAKNTGFETQFSTQNLIIED